MQRLLHKNILTTSVAGLFVAFFAAAMFAGQIAYAAPKCAVLDQGAVSCPSEVTGKGGNTCWYKDPGNTNAAGTVAGFTKSTSCNSDIFKEAANPQITSAEDPALTPCKSSKDTSSCDLVKKYVDPLIVTLSGAVGIVVTISIVYGGIQYSSSAGDPQKSAAAKSRIQNSIIALVAFFLLFALLEWLVPGGLLSNK